MELLSETKISNLEEDWFSNKKYFKPIDVHKLSLHLQRKFNKIELRSWRRAKFSNYRPTSNWGQNLRFRRWIDRIEKKATRKKSINLTPKTSFWDRCIFCGVSFNLRRKRWRILWKFSFWKLFDVYRRYS